MATYYARKNKLGDIISYGIQIKIKDNFGKTRFKSTTWDNPDNLTGKRLEKALHSFGESWEREIRNGNFHELSQSTFKQVADIWLKTRKHNMSESYYCRAVECISKLNDFFGNKKFVDLKAYNIQQFFIYLNEFQYKTSKAKLKANKMEEFDNIAKQYGIRKAGNEGDISRPTLYYARLGNLINLDSAKILCKKFNLELNDYFDKITVSKHYRKESMMKYKRILSTIFNYAISIELVHTNYASSAYLKGVIGGEKSRDIQVLTNEEYDSLLGILETHDIFDTIPIYLMTMLGIRTCEVCGLEWQDIDLENRIISIRRNRLYVNGFGIVRKDLKTKYSRRDLYICDELLDKLLAFKEKYETLKKGDKSFSKSGAIFCNEKGEPMFPHHLNNVLKRYLHEANCKEVSCHKIRHSWITKLISNGIPVNVVSKMAGHATTDITLKIYTHYAKDIDNSKEVLEKIFSKKAFI